jgi:hypothetical protein
MTDVAIPPRMQHLQRDRRGYPIPVIVMWTADGRPLFAANDEGERQRMFQEDRCHVCGDKLLRGRWFVGGGVSTCAEHGLVLDGGMHEECAHYALKVCPYLAAPVYSGLVGRSQVRNSDRAKVLIVETGTEQNTRPELFVALMAVAQEQSHSRMLPGMPEDFVYGVKPKPGSVRKVEVWRHGYQLDRDCDLGFAWAVVDALIHIAGDDWRPDVANLWKLT